MHPSIYIYRSNIPEGASRLKHYTCTCPPPPLSLYIYRERDLTYRRGPRGCSQFAPSLDQGSIGGVYASLVFEAKMWHDKRSLGN